MASEDKIVVGIDPDSDQHGVAIYNNGELIQLDMMDSIEIMRCPVVILNPIFSIENVMANDFCYSIKMPNGISNAAKEKIKLNRMLKVGRVQQAQKELMRWLDDSSIKYVLHKPQKGNWADNKAQFEKITGWTKQSNADTRSAAYFGWLEASK